MRFLERRSERAAARYHAVTGRLERISQVTNARALGIPMGVDLAGEEWVEPVLLPEVAPPPIPPAAFFKNEPTPAEEAEWRAALDAAKHTPEPSTDEWAAAMAAVKAKPAAVVAAAPAKAATPAPVVAPKAAAPRPRPSATQPIRLTAELRVGPKPVAARATEPRITLKGVATAPELGASKAGPTPVDPHVAAATKKTISAALRS
jgi:hypothetical protein